MHWKLFKIVQYDLLILSSPSGEKVIIHINRKKRIQGRFSTEK